MVGKRPIEKGTKGELKSAAVVTAAAAVTAAASVTANASQRRQRKRGRGVMGLAEGGGITKAGHDDVTWKGRKGSINSIKRTESVKMPSIRSSATSTLSLFFPRTCVCSPPFPLIPLKAVSGSYILLARRFLLFSLPFSFRSTTTKSPETGK